MSDWDWDPATAATLERAQLYTQFGRPSAAVQRVFKEIAAQHGRLCAEASCTRKATTWRRRNGKALVGLCKVHSARTSLDKRRALLEEMKKGMK